MTNEYNPARTHAIAALNDSFRKTLCHGKILLTPGITALSRISLMRVMDQIRRYSTFNDSNDPYNEHDFGSIKFGNLNIFWKIDYYDLNLENGSEDPADFRKTKRVMTIMLAEEY